MATSVDELIKAEILRIKKLYGDINTVIHSLGAFSYLLQCGVCFPDDNVGVFTKNHPIDLIVRPYLWKLYTEATKPGKKNFGRVDIVFLREIGNTIISDIEREFREKVYGKYPITEKEAWGVVWPHGTTEFSTQNGITPNLKVLTSVSYYVKKKEEEIERKKIEKERVDTERKKEIERKKIEKERVDTERKKKEERILDSYFKAERENNKIVITCCLYELARLKKLIRGSVMSLEDAKLHVNSMDNMKKLLGLDKVTSLLVDTSSTTDEPDLLKFPSREQELCGLF